MQRIPISEIFYSIQGEGPHMGRPSAFIRFAGCNLRCSFCDTKYAWKANTFIPEKTILDYLFDSLRNLNTFYRQTLRNVVFTGGEPMLYQKVIKKFLFDKRSRYLNVEIETNGTIEPNFDPPRPIDFIISPKLFDYGIETHYEIMYRHGFKGFFRKNTNVYFKFLIYPDVERNKATLKFIRDFNLKNVYVMPLGATPEELKKTADIAVEIAKKEGFNFSGRLQIWIWPEIGKGI